MTEDRTKTDSEPEKTRDAGRTGRFPAGKADRRADEIAAPTLAELSRCLAERAASQQSVDPGAAAAARRAALEAYELARERRLIVGLSVVLALTVGVALAYFVSTIEPRPLSRLPIAAVHPEPSLEIASAAVTSVLPDLSSSQPAPSTPPSPRRHKRLL